jgi:tetratricopeptide (TPR) repeat protein
MSGLFEAAFFFSCDGLSVYDYRDFVPPQLAPLGGTVMHRRNPALLLLLLVSLLASYVAAQHSGGNLHVFVTYPDDRPPTEQLRVALISGANGTELAETYTDEHGRAQFSNVGIGTYQLSVTGQSIQPTLSEIVDVDPRKTTQSVLVRVKPVVSDENAAGSGDPTISASDLKVPEEASREFDKASKLIAKQEWQKAIDPLNKAVALYPSYAEAYTNLGVVYARLGQPDKEREALQKAIAANDHFAPALVNLARLEIKDHNFAGAEVHLTQATTADPNDPQTLALLAQTQLLDKHYEAAIATAGKVHSMSHAAYALVHYVAARACERLNRLPDALKEFKLFLTEEPSGARAEAARKEMTAVQKQLQVTQP